MNRFKMPLLNIVGTTCLNTTFYVAFCFLVKEEVSDYIWAMEQLQKAFPPNVQSSVMVMDRELALMNAIHHVFPETHRLLCICHIEKNVLVHTSKEFGKAEDRDMFMKAWSDVVSSDTEEVYEKRWAMLESIFEDSVPGLVSYIRNTWLDLWKRLFIRAYTNKYLHFGNRVTSRVEGAHSTLKSYLQISTGDLKSVFDKITIMLTNQHAEYDGAIAHNRTRTPHTTNNPFYSQLLGRISNYTLGQLWNQRYRLTNIDSLTKCTGRFSNSMGLPCAHTIQSRLHENGYLTIDDIHPHWHFLPRVPSTATPLVLEPAIAQTRGRPSIQPSTRMTRTRLIASSTRRSPSAFERLDTSKENRN
jgi:MULE transposase domain